MHSGDDVGLTQKERVTAQIQHQETDFVPYTIGFEGDVAERLDVYYGDQHWRDLVDSAIRLLPIPSDGLLVDMDAGQTYTDVYGTTWRVDARPFHMVTPALKESSLKDYQMPSVEACFDPDWEDRASAFIAAWHDHFVVGFIGFGLFERTWTLRGFEGALTDSAANPAFYEELAERLVRHQMLLIERVLSLPVDGMMFSDDWGYQHGVLLGAKRWRQVIKPRLARMYAQVHAAGKYTLNHCCGSIVDIIPDLIEIGLDVLESVQPEADGMNPYELKRRFGKHITFWGALGSQSTIPFGTPAQIRAEVARLCGEMGQGGGYILAPAKDLQPETPTENAAAVVEAFLQQSGVNLPQWRKGGDSDTEPMKQVEAGEM
jgi:uroporphyrinogen decarboxylase